MRSENLIIDLCNEIDDLHNEVEYWKHKYEESNKKLNSVLDSSIRHSYLVGLGMVALATGDKKLAAIVAGDEVE